MTDKLIINLNEPETEYKEHAGQKFNTSKFDHDLFHDESNIILPVVRVKFVSLPHNGARWKIMKDNQVSYVIEGGKISRKGREFLMTVEGANWLLGEAKIGITSLNVLKKSLSIRLANSAT